MSSASNLLAIRAAAGLVRTLSLALSEVQQQGPAAVVADLVAELIRHPMHQFWPDGLSRLNQSGIDA
jgi:hypothetical protein